MKKVILSSVICLSTLMVQAQESKSKLKFHAANLGFGGFYVDTPGSSDAGGYGFLADVTLAIDKNLISVSYLAGTDDSIIGGATYSFNEPSLLYGREWKPTDWFALEGFAGVGYYLQKAETDEDNSMEKESTISFPLRLNTKFYFTRKFGMGINSNYSINSANNNLSVNLIFHYRFN